jgi:hypothetical protein
LIRKAVYGGRRVLIIEQWYYDFRLRDAEIANIPPVPPKAGLS